MILRNTKGIIKIKCGYNANSSSVSSSTGAFQLLPAIATTVIFVALILFFTFKNRLFPSKKAEDGEDEENEE